MTKDFQLILLSASNNAATSVPTLIPWVGNRVPINSYRAITTSPNNKLTSHNIFSRGKQSIKCTYAPLIPSSFAIPAANLVAARCNFGLAKSSRACASFSGVNSLTEIALGPTPARSTKYPHMNWSAKNGHTMVGRPNRNPAATVPAPPWCTTAQHMGNNQSCGHTPTLRNKSLPLFSGPVSTSNFVQPLWTITRTLAICAAFLIVDASSTGSLITILPNPMKIGLGCPLCIHDVNSANGVASKSLFWSTKNVPTTSHCSGQSIGFGTKDGDHMAENGTLAKFTKFNPDE